MSTALSVITALVRKIISDEVVTKTDVFEYLSSNVFTLTEDYPSTVTEVSVNDVTSGVTNSLDTTTNKVTVTATLVAGDAVAIIYTYYPKYSDNEIESFTQVALMELANRNFDFYRIDSQVIYPELTSREEYLIASVTAVLMEPNNKDIITRDMTVKAPAGSVSTSKMIDKILASYKKNTHGVFGI